MAQTMTENAGSTLQKGLSDWWSEETEYVLQRIERWAAFARGYNRLRSERLSRGRLTMQEEQEPRWSIANSKLIIDDSSWSPRFHALKRSRRKSRPEEARLNCCGSFGYQSNGSLDSTCLQTYSYDHSIYFKTIGEIRSSRKALEARTSISGQEPVELEDGVVSKVTGAQTAVEEGSGERRGSWTPLDCDDPATWPIVDLSKLELVDSEEDEPSEESWPVVDLSNLRSADTEDNRRPESNRDEMNNEIETARDCNAWTFETDSLIEQARVEVENNNYSKCEGCTEVLESGRRSKLEEQKNGEGLERCSSCRGPKDQVFGDHEAIWSGVLLKYRDDEGPGASLQLE